MKKKTWLFILLMVLTGVASAPATFIFTLSQVGPDVVVTGAGTLNLSALTFNNAVIGFGIQPNAGYISTSGLANSYSGVTGPATFGPGVSTSASSSSGDVVGVVGTFGFLYVPQGYVSGSLLSDTMTFSNATFASLGFTPGTYTYTWGSGITADSLTINTNVPTGTVPEGGASALLLGTSLAGLFVAHRRTSVRRHRSV